MAEKKEARKAAPAELKPLAIQLSPAKLEDLLHASFVKALRAEMPEISFDHLCLEILVGVKDGKDDFDHMTVGHKEREDVKNGVLTVSADTSQTADKLKKAVLAALASRGD